MWFNRLFASFSLFLLQHVLPDLKELEKMYSIEDGVVVVGVHSPKFDHEKDPSSVLNAVLRNEIMHPVVNDPACKLWQMLFVNCWPTLVILGPEGQVRISQQFLLHWYPINQSINRPNIQSEFGIILWRRLFLLQILFIFMGEGHRMQLLKNTTLCLEYFKSAGRISSHSLPIRSERDTAPISFLSYPAKVCTSPDGSLLAISDSGHHRVVIASNVGLVMVRKIVVDGIRIHWLIQCWNGHLIDWLVDRLSWFH